MYGTIRLAEENNMGINQRNGNQQGNGSNVVAPPTAVVQSTVDRLSPKIYTDSVESRIYLKTIKNELRYWSKATVFGPRIHDIIGNFEDWLGQRVQWIEDPEEWKRINLEENERCYDNTLEHAGSEFKQLVDAGRIAAHHIGDSIPEDEFDDVAGVYDNDTGNIYLSSAYHLRFRPTLSEIKRNILHEMGHYVSCSDQRNKLDYDFSGWKSLYEDLRDDGLLPSEYATINPGEGYAEIFRKYWGANSGLRRFSLSDYPDELRRAIGAL